MHPISRPLRVEDKLKIHSMITFASQKRLKIYEKELKSSKQEPFPPIICKVLLAVYITLQILPKKARNIFSF